MSTQAKFPDFVRAVSTSSGFKRSGRRDMALFRIEGAEAIGVFTENSMRSSNIDWSKTAIKNFRRNSSNRNEKYMLVLSGNANACTGRRGIESIVKASLELYGSAEEALKEGFMFFTTGVIGVPIDDEKLIRGVRILKEKLDKGESDDPKSIFQAISTTDRFEKVFYSHEPELLAIAKGAGMIAPSMATMLSFAFLNAYPRGFSPYPIFKKIVEKTFNSIVVDGDTSTNDAVVLFYRKPSTDAEPVSREKFERLLYEAFEYLAEKIVRDGEGASIVARVVAFAPSQKEARSISKVVASSLLFKAALAGRDPNWGRIAAAVGNSGLKLSPKDISIYVNSVPVFLKGEPTGEAVSIEGEEVDVKIVFKKEKRKWIYKTCDIGVPYIEFNSRYTT